jgi:hypothetical protein
MFLGAQIEPVLECLLEVVPNKLVFVRGGETRRTHEKIRHLLMKDGACPLGDAAVRRFLEQDMAKTVGVFERRSGFGGQESFRDKNVQVPIERTAGTRW